MSENISQKETIDLLNKCWMTHDGMWFFHCFREFGIEAANKINKAAIKSLAPIEIKRIRDALGFDRNIDSYADFKAFFEGASRYMIPDFMNAAFGYSEAGQITWEFAPGKCFAYTGIKRIGALDGYECGVLYRIKCWLEVLGLDHRFEPEIGSCHMHHSGHCSGNIDLFSHRAS